MENKSHQPFLLAIICYVGDLIPLLAGGGGGSANLNVTEETPSRKKGCPTPAPCLGIGLCKNRSLVEFSHNSFCKWALGFP